MYFWYSQSQWDHLKKKKNVKSTCNLKNGKDSGCQDDW